MKKLLTLTIALAACAVMGQDSVDIDGALVYPTNIMSTGYVTNIAFTHKSIVADYDDIYHIAGIEIEHDDTKETLIRRLAAEGHICEVLGHVWRYGEPLGSLVVMPNPSRTCLICDKYEQKKVGPWE